LHLAQHPEQCVSSKNDEDALSTIFLVEHENIDLEKHPWYKDIIYYLKFQKCPNNLENHQCRRICLEASKYLILGTFLFQRTIDGLLLHCGDNKTTQNVLNKIHGSTYSDIHISGHFAAKSTRFKVLRTGYY